MKKKIIYIAFILLYFLPLKAQKVFYSSKTLQDNKQQNIDTTQILYNVYLLGDIKPYEYGYQNLKTLQQKIETDTYSSAVVLLGDIAYPLGLPDSDEKSYITTKQSLDTILNTFNHYKDSVYIFAGNHDWARGRKQGWEHIRNLEKYIKNQPNQKIRFLPTSSCPGPIEVPLSDDIVLIVLDSQWWLHQNEKPPLSECGLQNKNDIFIHLEDIIKRNQNKKIIVTTHHPLYSVGNHGGYFPTSRLLFPLLDEKKYLYIPLPGFIYTGYRKYLGNIQDLANPQYKEFKQHLLEIFKKYPKIIYAAGHEHNMQYLEKDSLFHIISGGGGYGSYIAKKEKKANFAYENSGFVKLTFLQNGLVFITYYNKNGEILLQHKMYQKPVFNPKQQLAKIRSYQIPQDSILVKVSDRYEKAGKLQRKILGENYRKLWQTPVKLPVFDIGKEKGGLSIIKRGGGMQTFSLRLHSKDGKQYVLRSVDKQIPKVLPENFRHTFVEKPVQDAISASNPYGALTIPPMAEAINIMHTNPKLVYVPNDPRFGIYRNDVADKVFLFEERPAGDWHDATYFGNSSKIINTIKVIKKTQQKHNHIVDQKAVLKARLLDMILNDWDRHDDQWRWASFKENGNTVYRPIPRDRDQVYFVNQGFGMWLAARKWALRKFQGFNDTITDIAGLNFNARYFDRSFLNELDENDWLQTAKYIQKHLTDSIIHISIQQMPDTIYNLSGKEIEHDLKKRINDLITYTKQYYSFLTKEVDIPGTDKDELFEVNRLPNGNTKVIVTTLKNKTKKTTDTLYQRLFKINETKEIRLYGLKGKDIFKIYGNAHKGIKIRIIGGKNSDSIIDSSSVKGCSKKTLVYDRKDKKNHFKPNKETKLMLSTKKSVNKYNRLQFRYNKTIPLIESGYNADDGIFIGAGLIINRYHFRSMTKHTITAKAAFETNAYVFKYNLLFQNFRQGYDFKLNTEISMPRNVDNFFGLGNETIKLTDDKTFNRMRYHFIEFNPEIQHHLNKSIKFSAGLYYQYFKLTDTLGHFVGDINLSGLELADYEAYNDFGLKTMFQIDTRDNKIVPRHGILWHSDLQWNYQIDANQNNFVNLKSDIAMYIGFKQDPRWVWAFHLGAAKIFGDYRFYQANFIGSDDYLRGFKNNRFGGDTYVFQNTELRLKLGNIHSYLLNGETGISVFNDIARVWYENENSSTWHDGYGIEYWLVPFDMTVLRLSLQKSEEDLFLNLKFSYNF